MNIALCLDCAHERKQMPATYTIPNGTGVIPLCDAHADRASRYHHVTPIEETA